VGIAEETAIGVLAVNRTGDTPMAKSSAFDGLQSFPLLQQGKGTKGGEEPATSNSTIAIPVHRPIPMSVQSGEIRDPQQNFKNPP